MSQERNKEQTKEGKGLATWVAVIMLVVVFVCAWVGETYLKKTKKPMPSIEDKTDTAFIELRFETSDDLVQELGGLHLYRTYRIECNDGKIRPAKVVLLDRKLRRVGLVVVSTASVGSGYRVYDTRGTAFVSLDWFISTIREEK